MSLFLAILIYYYSSSDTPRPRQVHNNTTSITHILALVA